MRYYKTITIVFLLFIILVIAGCATQPGARKRFLGSGDGDNKVTTPKYLQGTEAIIMQLEDPKEIVVAPGDTLYFGFTMENMGATNINQIETLLSGFDSSYLSNVGFPSGKPTGLTGKTQYGPGQREFYSMEGSVNDIQGLSLSQDVSINICYPYSTHATFEVCVDANGRDDTNGCPREATYSLSGGQGAPVSIESAYYESRRTAGGSQGTFVLHFKQVGTANNLLILDETRTNQYCQDNPQGLNFRQDQGIITINEIMLGNKDILKTGKCPSLQGGNKLNLARRNDLICYISIESAADYTTALTIDITYGIRQTIAQEVVIQQLYPKSQ